MIIRITYPNVFHGSDFPFFLYELLMNLRNISDNENSPFFFFRSLKFSMDIYSSKGSAEINRLKVQWLRNCGTVLARK